MKEGDKGRSAVRLPPVEVGRTIEDLAREALADPSNLLPPPREPHAEALAGRQRHERERLDEARVALPVVRSRPGLLTAFSVTFALGVITLLTMDASDLTIWSLIGVVLIAYFGIVVPLSVKAVVRAESFTYRVFPLRREVSFSDVTEVNVVPVFGGVPGVGYNVQVRHRGRVQPVGLLFMANRLEVISAILERSAKHGKVRVDPEIERWIERYRARLARVAARRASSPGDGRGAGAGRPVTIARSPIEEER